MREFVAASRSNSSLARIERYCRIVSTPTLPARACPNNQGKVISSRKSLALIPIFCCATGVRARMVRGWRGNVHRRRLEVTGTAYERVALHLRDLLVQSVLIHFVGRAIPFGRSFAQYEEPRQGHKQGDDHEATEYGEKNGGEGCPPSCLWHRQR